MKRQLSDYTSMEGWEGFFRPKEETNDNEDDEDKSMSVYELVYDGTYGKGAYDEVTKGLQHFKELLEQTGKRVSAYEAFREMGRKWAEKDKKWHNSKEEWEYYNGPHRQ